MIEIIQWLANIERKVGELYRDAANLFVADKEFSAFLNHLAADEDWHFQVMGSASQSVRKGLNHKSLVSLDDATKNETESRLLQLKESLAGAPRSRRSLLESIIATEFSELNHIFLYVVNVLRESGEEFRHVAPKIQQHVRYIERFAEKSPDCSDLLPRIRSLLPVWKDKILIVDDSKTTRDLLCAILKGEGEIETAQDGNEGYMKVCTEYFAVILSDIDMPVMDGIEFYRRCSSSFPGIRKRFLFLTGDPEPKRIGYLTRNGIRFLRKPAPIGEIKKSVSDIIKSATAH